MASRQHSDEYVPAGHVDDVEDGAAPRGPRLGPVGWARFAWRQLTSMRTALVLLLLLAVAAIPGSLVPQVTSDPNGVLQWKANDPQGSQVLEALGLFNVYASPWFSAVYILLFISLIGCVLPRIIQHSRALVSPPPRVPARLGRLAGHTVRPFDGGAADAVEAARATLAARGYRTVVRDGAVSAERGYLRETGNLVFHLSLVGVLVSVAVGGSVGYTGQRVIAEGQAFTNVLSGYDSVTQGRFFTDSMLAPFTLRLDGFSVDYVEDDFDSYGTALNYEATLTVTEPGVESRQETLRVNGPLTVGGAQVYLLGNGYAPVLTIRDPDGNVVFSQPTMFRPQDTNLTSIGVVKVPDGLAEQIGMQGFLYPTASQLSSGAFTSVYPDVLDPLITLEVYMGDLGLDDGIARNAYTLDTDSLEQIAGRDSDEPTIELRLGETAELPDGLGTIEFTAVPRFIAVDIHWDPARGWVLVFALTAIAGLLASLFVPRRRVFARAVVADGGTALEWAGLARGEDPRIEDAVGALADEAARRGGAQAGGGAEGSGA